MTKGLGAGGVILTLVGAAVAGPSISANLEAAVWAISPEETACHTDLELTARSGAVAPAPSWRA